MPWASQVPLKIIFMPGVPSFNAFQFRLFNAIILVCIDRVYIEQ